MDFPIDEPKNNGITALGIAAYRGNVPMMQRLFNAGANPLFINKSGIGALYLSLKGNKLDSTVFLLNKGVPMWYEDL